LTKLWYFLTYADKTKENPTNFTPGGSLGLLFEKAKSHNHFNELLKKELPKSLLDSLYV
jgi:hypothetical protein